MQTQTSKPPFNVGDQVSVVRDIYSTSPTGKVVDVWQVRDSWMVMVDHDGFDYAYAPNELSLDNSEVVHVDFKAKQRRA